VESGAEGDRAKGVAMRIGIFGGSFNPVHMGHLIAAESAREQASLDRVLFMPAAHPPHKLDQHLAPATDRLAMLTLATASNPAFDVSCDELDRGGVSYTVDTLADLASQWPGDPLVLLLGPDAVRGLPTCREPERIAELAELVTVERDRLDDAACLRDDERLRTVLGADRVEQLIEHRVRMPAVGIRATDIREAVRAGRSIRYLVPAAVAAYISQHSLYAGSEPFQL